jgi:hypothetical protein
MSLLSKFPVHSETGKEYMVKIFNGYSSDNVVVKVYYRTNHWLLRWDRVSGKEWMGYYRLEEWEYDFIDMAKNQLKLHETEVVNREINKEKFKNGLKKFKEWNGK